MFWEVWRNVTSATTSWGLGGNANKKDRSSNKSNKKSCYDRLISSPITSSTGGPRKSASQPVNLTRFTRDDICNDSTPTKEPSSQLTPNDESSSKQTTKKEGPATTQAGGKCGGVKRSFSSFFPFSSCTSDGATIKPRSSDIQQQSCIKRNTKMIVTAGNEVMVVPTSGFQRDQVQLQTTKCTNQGQPNDDRIIDYWDENMELPTCDVCTKAFPTVRQLAAHQRKKRHYGCIECDSIFPSREVLECHREQMCHYEFAIDMYTGDEGDLNDEDDFFESEDDENGAVWDEDEDEDDEEMERLL